MVLGVSKATDRIPDGAQVAVDGVPHRAVDGSVPASSHPAVAAAHRAVRGSRCESQS